MLYTRVGELKVSHSPSDLLQSDKSFKLTVIVRQSDSVLENCGGCGEK
jgi:hypothetical protein